jgi:glycosyltransferase involved in cell wall biosynthesis
MNLTVIILTCDEEKNLPDCLASLRGLQCPVFVVDSGSSDGTVAIARAVGAQVFEHRFEHYGQQRNWAQRDLPIRTDWVLHLDADERLTPELVDEIRKVLSEENSALDKIDGFMLCKRTFFMGRWIKHGGHYPSYHLRLFRKEKGFCEERFYDQHFIVDGSVAKLHNDYLDILSADLDRWIQRHLRWAALEARQWLSNDGGQVAARFFGNPIERKRWLREKLYDRSPLFIRPFLFWLYRYFFRAGFLDGKEGFIFHFLQGFWFRLLVDIKITGQRSEIRGRPLGDGVCEVVVRDL